MKVICRVFCAILVFGLAACSSFERGWRRAGREAHHDPFAGRWDGRWTSAKHANAGGRLRCVLRPIDARHYGASFKANWLAFTSTYEATLDAERRGNELHFQGAHRLPAMFGGVYRYSGRATPQKFNARYHSSYDHGTFEMTKVADASRARGASSESRASSTR